MQIVIDIPKHYFDNNIKKELPICLTEEQIVCILPKGHGRLIECERLQEVFRRNVVGYAGFKRLFDIAPTIIEADSESEE